MVGEGGVKNALDPSLGSQAPSMAPVLRAVIWLEQRLTIKIDGDRGGISKINLSVTLQDFCFFLLQKPYTNHDCVAFLDALRKVHLSVLQFSPSKCQSTTHNCYVTIFQL